MNSETKVEFFKIGDHDFTIDDDKTIIEVEGNEIIDLTIKASEVVFDKLCEDEEFEFGYGSYAPEFYAREIPLSNDGKIEINEKNLYDYEIALYFMEHNDVNLTILVNKEWILIKGISNVWGTTYPIEIKIRNRQQ